MTEDELRQRARTWRERATASRDERERTSCERIAREYEAMADRAAAARPAPDED